MIVIGELKTHYNDLKITVEEGQEMEIIYKVVFFVKK